MTLLRNVQGELLSRLGRVGVTARHAVESVLAGQHRSIHRGLSVEFAGHRPYQPGDDLRHLDWRVFARTDRYDVRLYEEETRLRATIVLDCSGSMGYGPAGRTKLDHARLMAAGLAFLMARQGDGVGLCTVDTAIREHLPPASTMGHLLSLLEILEHTQAGGDTDLAPVIDQVAERMHRRGLVILITDAYDDSERLVTALRHLRFRKQDVRVFRIAHADETTFPFHGTYEFVGLEDEDRLKLDSDRVRHRYLEALRAHEQAVAAGCHSADIPLEACRTDEDLALTLVRAFNRLHGGGGRRR